MLPLHYVFEAQLVLAVNQVKRELAAEPKAWVRQILCDGITVEHHVQVDEIRWVVGLLYVSTRWIHVEWETLPWCDLAPHV